MGFGDGGFRGGDAFEGVEGAPGLDEAAEGDVGGEIGVGEGLFGDGAGGFVLGEYPVLDAFSVVCYAGADGDGVLHDVQRNGAEEIRGNLDFVGH